MSVPGKVLNIIILERMIGKVDVTLREQQEVILDMTHRVLTRLQLMDFWKTRDIVDRDDIYEDTIGCPRNL